MFGAEAAYTPLAVEGAKADHAIAYLRGEDVATVVPRLVVSWAAIWAGDSRWSCRRADGGIG